MAIPKYNQIFQPMLRVCSDGNPHKVSDLVEVLADDFKLSDEDRTELLPSGGERVFKNRVWWARTFLFKAELIMSPKRGYIQISALGEKILKEGIVVDGDFLKTLPNFEKNWGNKTDRREESAEIPLSENLTPRDLIENGYKQIQDELIKELLNQVRTNVTPGDFETLVVELLVRMGYGGSRKDAGKAIGKSGDGGIDGLISEDRLGLSKIYIQAKRWEGNVGDVEIRNFLGSIATKGATKGVLITTSDFTPQAMETIRNNRSSVQIVLVNGLMLAGLMVEHDLGVTLKSLYNVKEIDFDYFNQE